MILKMETIPSKMTSEYTKGVSFAPHDRYENYEVDFEKILRGLGNDRYENYEVDFEEILRGLGSVPFSAGAVELEVFEIEVPAAEEAEVTPIPASTALLHSSDAHVIEPNAVYHELSSLIMPLSCEIRIDSEPAGADHYSGQAGVPVRYILYFQGIDNCHLFF